MAHPFENLRVSAVHRGLSIGGTLGWMGQKRSSVLEGISHDAYYKFHYSLIFLYLYFFHPFLLLFFWLCFLDHNPLFSVLFLIIIPLTSPTIFTKAYQCSTDNHIFPKLPLQQLSHEISHTLHYYPPLSSEFILFSIWHWAPVYKIGRSCLTKTIIFLDPNKLGCITHDNSAPLTRIE